MSKCLWKSMRKGLESGHGDMKWKVGKWYKVNGVLEMCRNGLHASEKILDTMAYVPLENLVKVEVRGKHLSQSDKQCWSEMRIVKAWKWEKKDSVALAVYAAELVLENFEKEYPDDKRPREAIEAAKKVLKRDSQKNRSAAWSARSAAESAAESEIVDKIEAWIKRRIKTLKVIGKTNES